MRKCQEIQVTLFPAGHILGAASVYISTPEGSLFYSGDISADKQRTIPKANVPRLNPSVCIFESTYGNRLHPDTSSFMPLLHEIAGESAINISKISWNTEAKCVTLTTSAPLHSEKEIADQFYNTTGYRLILPNGEAKQTEQDQAPAIDAFNPKCSQQEAMQEIDDIFKPEAIVIYKKSVRTQGCVKFIELQFITPAMGQRYEKWLSGIHEMTGWPVTIAANPRQQELIMLAKSCAASHGLTIAKGPSIRQSDQCVEISIAWGTETKKITQAQVEFERQSGYQLRIS